jgi:3-oxoacyl-[acyl-carrier protein] reductase
MSRAFVPAMPRRRWGRIVNIASAAGRVHIPMAPGPYSAAKAGVIALSKTLAQELGPFGITVNRVAPGRIDTPMGAEQRRAGAPDAFAAAVKYFVSDGSSRPLKKSLAIGIVL